MFAGVDWTKMDWNNVAQALLGFIVAVLFWAGNRLRAGKAPVPIITNAPAQTSGTTVAPAVEINALVDSRSLSQHTAALEALNLTMLTGLKQQKETSDKLQKVLDKISESMEDISSGMGGMEELPKVLRGVGYAIDKTKEEIQDLDRDVKTLTLEMIRHKP